MARARPIDWRNPDYGPVYRERVERLRTVRSMTRRELNLLHGFYADDHPIEWIEDWATTFDPRRLESDQPATRPLVLFPRQRELIQFFHSCNAERDDGVVEKCREVGVSWCAMAYAIYLWLYRHGAVIGFGSYEQDRVDKLGVADSLLEKGRIILRNLPPEMRPAGLDLSEGGHLLLKRLLNPVTGSQIIGEIGTNIGRGGRATMYFVDEYAFLKHHDTIDSSLASTTECRIYMSTPNGVGAFFRKTKNPKFRQFRFAWREDPRKDDAWYRDYLERWGPVITAREVDIDHHASVEDLVIEGKWVEASTKVAGALRAKGVRVPTRLDYQVGVAGLDVGGGSHPSVFIARYGPILSAPESWTTDEGDTTITGQKALRLARAARTPILNFDGPGVGKGVSSTLRHSSVEERRIDPIPVSAPTPSPDEDGISVDEKMRRLFALSEEVPAPTPELEILARAIFTGTPASKTVRWPDGKTSREKFVDLRAELWWTMRERFIATYQTWLWCIDDPRGQLHPIDDLLFLDPDWTQLRTELTGPKYFERPGSKIMVESKKDMAKRGVPSPDEADALALTFVPTPPRVGESKLKGFY